MCATVAFILHFVPMSERRFEYEPYTPVRQKLVVWLTDLCVIPSHLNLNKSMARGSTNLNGKLLYLHLPLDVEKCISWLLRQRHWVRIIPWLCKKRIADSLSWTRLEGVRRFILTKTSEMNLKSENVVDSITEQWGCVCVCARAFHFSISGGALLQKICFIFDVLTLKSLSYKM